MGLAVLRNLAKRVFFNIWWRGRNIADKKKKKRFLIIKSTEKPVIRLVYHNGCNKVMRAHCSLLGLSINLKLVWEL